MALATGKETYAIKTTLGYIHGIDKSWMICQNTDWITSAKSFNTQKAAQKFIDKWDGTGIGLNAEDCVIVPKTF